VLRGLINQVIRGAFGQVPWNNSPGIAFPPFRQPWIISPRRKLLINAHRQLLCQFKIHMEPKAAQNRPEEIRSFRSHSLEK
jgi:hypothetical protein